jgi:hypothetical protein
VSVEQQDVVDFIGDDPKSGRVVLTVSDHLPWEDLEQHLKALENKIAAYVRFVQGGRLLETRPAAAGKAIEIEVLLRYPPTAAAIKSLDKSQAELSKLGIAFCHRMLPQGY